MLPEDTCTVHPAAYVVVRPAWRPSAPCCSLSPSSGRQRVIPIAMSRGPNRSRVSPPPGFLESAVRLKVDVASGRVEVAPLKPAAPQRDDGLTPSFALLGWNEIAVAASNFSRTSAGIGRVRIRFDLKVTNKLKHSDLITPTFPAPPSGVTGVLLFPFKTVALGSNGQPLPLAESRAVASVDWNGTGASGSGAPHNFFNSATCLPLLGGDCFRWESFGTVAAGATTPAHTVGFDADLLVSSLDVYVVLAADISENALTGGISGTVASTLFGPLPNASVTVSPGGQTGTSDGSGNYLIGGLTPGSKTVSLGGTPASCFRPSPQTVAVAAGATADADFNLACRPIVFTQFVGSGVYEIFRIGADGTGETRLTTDNDIAVDPTWSPDGSRIAYAGGGEIIVMNANGTGRDPLTNDAFSDSEPDWSRDGSKIVFVSFRGGQTDLWTINQDGTGQTQLTSSAGSERDPTWSPDGSRIAFQQGGNIHVMNAAPGSSPTQLTTNSFGDGYPDWSPDGSKIAYVATSEADDGEGSADHLYEVFVMNPDGSNRTQVTHDDFFDLQPAWSPDGSKLVYSSYRPGTPSLVIVDATGGTPVPLTPDGEAAAW